MARSLGELGHLARRFASSLHPVPPSPADEAWALAHIDPALQPLWAAQAAVDRAHTIGVARALLAWAEASGSGTPPSWAVPAALLHDIGKAGAPLGPFGRVVATALEFCRLSHVPGRLGRYLRYPELGAARLAAAGAPAPVVAWAREHHRSPRFWTVAEPWASALATADKTADRRPACRRRASWESHSLTK